MGSIRVNLGQCGSNGVNCGQSGSIGVDVSCFKFELSVTSGTIKDPPIHHILVGCLEDMVVSDAYCTDS